ncbi:hypothetical protein [Tateyamaria sp. SN6-1]|uniref:hypothetical protein n=1 Tax=Tateyamaria sp. SN6-1 TaxID=3092148 RepID=UPI0039F5BBDF
MTLVCCGKEMPENMDDLLDDKTEIHPAFRQFAKHRAAGAEIEFLMDVARQRNIKAIYDTYIARQDHGLGGFGFDFGFGDQDEDEVIFQMYPHLRPKEPAQVKPKSGFTLVNKVFSRRKKTPARRAASTTPAAPVAPAIPANAPKTLNGQAFGRNGEVDEMLALGRANNFNESDWRPLLEDAYTEVSKFLVRDNIVTGFFKSEQFEKALQPVVERLVAPKASSILRALPISSGNGTPSSDDFILVAALAETKMATLLNAYSNKGFQTRMQTGEKYFNSLKGTWGFEMEFWTFRNYLSRF